jgi:hypothetical protein
MKNSIQSISTEQELLQTYRMTVLLPPPEGIYKNNRTLADDKMKEFLEIKSIEEANLFYNYWTKQNYTDEFKKLLKEIN